MMSPVTSTSVATNGADDVAGSKPNLRRMNGSPQPTSVPQRTTPTSANATVVATISQCGPYRFENADHTEIRRKPMAPRIAPSARPTSTSRLMTLQKSAIDTSPTASARMTSVEPCDPELPPLEMMSG